MIERAVSAGVPFGWVAADSVYGVGDIEMALRRGGKGYVLGVRAATGSAPGTSRSRSPAQPRRSRAGLILRPGNAYRRGRHQGARLHDWAIASWPISTLPNTTATEPACGPGGS